MIAIPKFLFHTLIRLPLIGGALRRSPDEIEVLPNSIQVPFFWLIDAMFRTLFCLVAVGVIIFLVIENLPEQPTKDVALADAVYLENEEFKKMLGFYDREELTQLLDLNVLDLEVSDSRRRRGIVNQILAADKVGKSPMHSRKLLGISTELDLRIELALSDLQNDRFDVENNRRLIELSELYESINFREEDEKTESVKEKAGVGLMLANFVASVEDPSESSADVKASQAVGKLEQVGQKFVISKQSEATIGKLLEHSRNRLAQLNKPTLWCDTLKNTLADVISDNRETAISEFSILEPSSASASRLDYLEEEESVRKDRFLRDFESALSRVIQCGDLGEKEYGLMLDKLEGLFRGGWTHATRRILAEVTELMASTGEFPELRPKVERLRFHLNRIGQTLENTDLKTLADRPADLGGLSVESTFVLYVRLKEEFVSVQEDDITHESRAKVANFARVFNNLASLKRLGFFVVIVHEDEKERAKTVIKGKLKNLDPIEFLLLNSTSAAGKELAQTVPIQDLPYVLILDRQSRIAAIDPRPTQTIDIVGKLKLMDR